VQNLKRVAHVLLCGAAVSCLWLLAINRVLIELEDGSFKTLSLALATALFGLLAFQAARRVEPRWAVAASSVLILCGIGEVHRAWLRDSYGARGIPPEPWVAPITTTDLVVRHFDQPLPERKLAPVRVVHLTDLHISRALPAEYFADLHERIRGAHADVLVMTGDYVSDIERFPLLEEWLTGLPEMRLGSYAVLGNHDYWTGEGGTIRAAFEASSVRVLQGRCVTLDAIPLRICGTEAPWGPELEAWDGPEMTTLALSHTPDNIYALSELGADLVFAGHTHGGQARLPGVGALIIPSRFGRRFDRGHFDVNGTHLFVSSGVGADAPALRLWCQPDLVVVDVHG
jgi:uncharacterized protein